MVPFVCVNYSSEKETKEYVINVFGLKQSEEAYIIVVDNSPDMESYNNLQNFMLENGFMQRATLLKRHNKGYFNALNEGIDYAISLFGKTTMIIGNNDIKFANNFIELILGNLIINKNHLIIAPVVITSDGRHENPHVIHKMGFFRKLKYDLYFSHYYIASFLRIFKKDSRPKRDFDPIRKDIYSGIGALYILTVNFFHHFDRLRDEVFLYGEEAILSGQIDYVGGKILYEPSLICYHNESSTTSKLPTKSKYELMRTSYSIYRKYL